MTNEMIKIDEQTDTQKVCSVLIKNPYYAKIGNEGLYAIVTNARSLGIDPEQCLNGGLYYVKGKVEMSARMMNSLIRSKQHSVTKDKASNDRICILHGKRADNGDTWSESFSIEEASRAGLLGSAVWKTYPRDMLFARALSRLARQLFPDVIGNCYVEHEIGIDENIRDPIEEAIVDTKDDKISKEECTLLEETLIKVPDYKEVVENFFIEKRGITSFMDIDRASYDKILKKATDMLESKDES